MLTGQRAGVQVYTVYPSSSSGQPDRNKYGIPAGTYIDAEWVLQRFQAHLPHKVHRIERVDNPALRTMFQDEHTRARGTLREEFAWHGTSKEAAWRIVHEGFRVGASGGVYVAHDSNYSWNYCLQPKQMAQGPPPVSVVSTTNRWPHEWQGTHVMLLCRILTSTHWGPGSAQALVTNKHAYPEFLLHI